MSSLLGQILSPYGATEQTAALCGTTLIVSGLVAAVIVSPIVDRYGLALIALKIQVPIIGISYLVLIWTPSLAVEATYVVLGIIGACSFSLLPISLDLLVEVTRPIAPEVTSAVCWMVGQLLSIVFVLIMQSLKAGEASNPPFKMERSVLEVPV